MRLLQLPRADAPAPTRPSGVREVARFNWPMYAVGATTVVLGWALARRLPVRPARLARAGAATAAALLVGSTAATWWVYDHARPFSFDWLDDLLPEGPGDHLVLSAGLDEAARPLAARHPGAAQCVVDLYDPALMTTGSIRRAHRLTGGAAQGALPGRPTALPVESAAHDSVFAVFAAHELRRREDREALFAECVRVLRPGGALVLVEHRRDAANAAAYGPGAWHFLPRAEWLRLADHAGLRRGAERRIAGLVTAFAFRKEAAA
ncbi:methyltransferase domain-containing protein [Streptacidiphilus jiangxiensis]|uniref:Methyltransferase domain-containing protein n=1 Tax=Streptacidiphilus jiangxiensis TaxID=235985 RepID=A0A1H7WYZ2_STRJI|nr:methyltransferase domain-containing protein [Streptacidiphilus jiangxiensis]SEM26846.1 Methyltransferase domain-containing protein [Streptacidiphilus jiangxiensis]